MIWTDFHSHVLPCIDDGASSPEVSIEMLRLAASQNVSTIVATPHYKLSDGTPSEFANRRSQAVKLLEPLLSEEGLPRIVLGCEIMLTQHIEEIDLTPLITEEFNTMLFEFPLTGFRRWITEEIENIALKYKITPVIAHFERYAPIPEESIEELASIDGIVFQFNNTALKSKSAVRRMDSLLGMGVPIILSSDAHSNDFRQYNFDIPNSIMSRHSLINMSARKLLNRIINSPAPLFAK